jgi:acyl dehydratase
MIPALGETASLTRTTTEDDVQQFAELVGDNNPVHIDDEFAKKTRFGRRIAHGMGGCRSFRQCLALSFPVPVPSI